MASKKVKVTEDKLAAKDIKGSVPDVLLRAAKVKMPTKAQMHCTYLALRRVLRAAQLLQKVDPKEKYPLLKDSETLGTARRWANPTYSNALSTDIKRVEKEIADVMHTVYYKGGL